VRRGFTLVELLTALAIVALLAAVIFPVLARARASGYRAESTAHLRQVGAAIELYRSDHDGELAFDHLDAFVDSGYLRTPRLLVSQTDAFPDGYGRTVSECIDEPNPTALLTSYETSLVSRQFYDYVRSVDEAAAIVVDRTHGAVLEQADQSCRWAQFFYSGTILRLYDDTHVKLAQFSFMPRNAPPDVAMHWSRLRLFTDVEPDSRP
jgi:prepilin-type N-terminal cleavage/methylation domain-containing protein